MLKNKSIDYIFGMITGASLMVTFWACTSDVTGAGSGAGLDVQEVKIVNANYDPIYVTSKVSTPVYVDVVN